MFAVYGCFRKGKTFVPAETFSSRSVNVSYLGILLQGIILFSILYYMPLYYEGVHEYSPVVAGVAMFPETFTVIPAAMVIGGVSSKTGSYRWASWGGWAMTALGTGLLYLLDAEASVAKWVLINIVAGFGLGMLYPGTVIAVMASCPQEHVAMAAGMSSFFRTVGQSIGVVVGGPIFQNRLQATLQRESSRLSMLASQYARDATGIVEIMKDMPVGSEKQDLKTAYADALKPVWATMCGLAGRRAADQLPAPSLFNGSAFDH